MSDFNKQAQEAMKQGEQLTNTWMETQKQMLNNYTDIMQTMMGMGTSSSTSGLEGERKKALTIMEDSVQKSLDLQAEMTRMYMQNAMSAMRLPEPLMTGAKQYQQMVMGVTESQKNLSHMFFEMARNYGDATSMASMDSWQKSGERVTQAWQEAAKTVSNAQAEVMQATAKAGEKTAKAAQ